MDWLSWTFVGTGVVYAIVFESLLRSHKKKSIGLGQFARTPQQVESTVSTRIAPAPFYYKQRTFRLCYGMIQAFDKLLLITSILYSAITAYLILDESIPTSKTVVCLGISAVSSTLKASLGLEKMAKPYIDAVRIMEQAILCYEYSGISPAPSPNPVLDPEPGDIPQAPGSSDSEKGNPYQILLDANEAAERLISHV